MSRRFWRLEDAYDDFSAKPLTGTLTNDGGFPVQVEIGQVFVVDVERTDGSISRRLYRSDATIWEGRARLRGLLQIDGQSIAFGD